MSIEVFRVNKGMSLVELVLAMTLFGIVVFAGTGVTTSASRLATNSKNQVNVNEDLEQVFALFERYIRNGVKGKKIQWEMLNGVFTFGGAPSIRLTGTSLVDQRIKYRSFVGGRTQLGNNMGIIGGWNSFDYLGLYDVTRNMNDAVMSAVRVQVDAVLKDYDGDGVIGPLDETRKEQCLTTKDMGNCVQNYSRAGVNIACMTANKVNLDSPECINSNVFPGIEINAAHDVIYLTLRNKLYKKDKVFLGPPITRAYYLYPDQDD